MELQERLLNAVIDLSFVGGGELGGSPSGASQPQVFIGFTGSVKKVKHTLLTPLVSPRIEYCLNDNGLISSHKYFMILRVRNPFLTLFE